MLRHWVNRVSPPPTISALVEALTSPVINRGDIASEVETIPVRIISFLNHNMYTANIIFLDGESHVGSDW